jgi:hypothetical protein
MWIHSGNQSLYCGALVSENTQTGWNVGRPASRSVMMGGWGSITVHQQIAAKWQSRASQPVTRDPIIRSRVTGLGDVRLWGRRMGFETYHSRRDSQHVTKRNGIKFYFLNAIKNGRNISLGGLRPADGWYENIWNDWVSLKLRTKSTASCVWNCY